MLLAARVEAVGSFRFAQKPPTWAATRRHAGREERQVYVAELGAALGGAGKRKRAKDPSGAAADAEKESHVVQYDGTSLGGVDGALSIVGGGDL